MEDKKVLKIIDNNGQETEYTILIAFYWTKTKKNYLVYTDNTRDEEGNVEVYASIYDPEDPHSKLEAITTEKEWKVIETILDTLQEEVRKKKNNIENNEQ